MSGSSLPAPWGEAALLFELNVVEAEGRAPLGLSFADAAHPKAPTTRRRPAPFRLMVYFFQPG
ncbi:MAG: hypothetical protein ACLPUO_24075 [Streptosporangiaceae bacterium]